MSIHNRYLSLMTLQEVADYLQVSDRSVRRFVAQGKLIGMKIGSQWRFHKKEVDRIAFGNAPGGTDDA